MPRVTASPSPYVGERQRLQACVCVFSQVGGEKGERKDNKEGRVGKVGGSVYGEGGGERKRKEEEVNEKMCACIFHRSGEEEKERVKEEIKERME